MCIVLRLSFYCKLHLVEILVTKRLCFFFGFLNDGCMLHEILLFDDT